MAARILVVDDDPDIRDSMREILEIEGYDVDVADNGAEALKRLHARRPELILLDLYMPVMDGVEFRRHQQSDPKLAQIPVVVVSAAHALEKQIAPMGVAGWLRKPVNLDDLYAVIDRWV